MTHSGVILMFVYIFPFRFEPIHLLYRSQNLFLGHLFLEKLCPLNFHNQPFGVRISCC